MTNVCLSPVGYVHNTVNEKVDENWGQVTSRIKLEAQYRGGLLGLETFSHVIIIYSLSAADYDPQEHLQRHPREREDLPLVGIFAQRAKNRPNTIGMTAVKIAAVGEDWLDVNGLDAIDGTPVLDIKPYYPAYDRRDDATTPEWVNLILEKYF